MHRARTPAAPAYRPAVSAVAAVVLALGVLLVGWGGTAPAAHATSGPAAPDSGPYLGAVLDWSTDSPTEYRSRFGTGAAVYGYDAPMPLADADVEALRSAVEAAEAQGASLLVTLLPAVPLAELDDATVDDVVADLEAAGLGDGRDAWVRPLPEMNASWRAWGQQPTESVSVFRRLATAVHARLDGVGTVWQPVYGAGYPFGSEPRLTRRDAGRTTDDELDTDDDGRLTFRDDPYGPYWPGAAVVDWIGMSHYHFGESYPFVSNVRPPAGKLLDQLAGRYGYPDDRDRSRRDFYTRFVEETGRPMILETAALYAPAGVGATEAAVKRTWFRQVADPQVRERYPAIGMVLWLELRRPEAESRDRVVDWRATGSAPLATSFAELLVGPADLTTGPDGPGEPRAPDAAEPGPAGTVLSGGDALTTSGAMTLAGAALIAGTALHRRRRWTYDDAAPSRSRDLRIDMLRGIAICLVVVDHIDVASLWQLLTQEAIGPVSGAELFVLLSGVVLGVVYGPRVRDTTGWYDAATLMWRRAGKLWATALAVLVVIYAVALLPGIDARVVTTFTDQGTGDAGAAARGKVYDLYAGFDNLFDFPIPGWALRDVLLLRMGPSQVNIIGLYVVLLLVAPLLAWALLRGRTWLVLLVSLGAYTFYQLHPVRVLPAQFENPFPLLAWQLLFVLGLVGGWHRERLLAAARRPAGRLLLVLVAVTTVALVVFAWSSPYLSNEYDVRLDLVPADEFRAVYDAWFPRTSLGPGRVLAAVCVPIAGYVLLSRFWSPVDRALGWFLLPLGQATLYVFVMHVFFVVAVANIPLLTSSIWWGTLTHTLVLAALWVMVRTRFLFKVVPT